MLVVTEVMVWVRVSTVVPDRMSVWVSVVTPAMMELVTTVTMLVVTVKLEVCSCVSVEATTVEMELGVKTELVLVVLVVKLTWVKISEVMEKVVSVAVVVVAPCRVAVMTGVGGGAVQATGKRLLHARRNVEKGTTPKAVQLPATQALVPTTPRQSSRAVARTEFMGSATVYGCRP